MKRLCAGGCKRLVDKGKCSECRRQVSRERERGRVRNRPNANARGYDYEYQQNRKILLANSTHCWICGLPLSTVDRENTADHFPIPRGEPGSNDISNLRPAHLGCNSSRQLKGNTIKE